MPEAPRRSVIDSDDLLARPAATMAAYCAAVGLPLTRGRLPGTKANGPSGTGPPAGTPTPAPAPASNGANVTYQRTVENSEKLARYAAHHRPFYEKLYAQRMNVSPWERTTGP